MTSDTIAAIATAVQTAGIGIIRVSGDSAIQIVDRVFRSSGGGKRLTDYKSHTINYGFIYNEGELLDEVMVSVMKAPKSYTMENTVEINCHGGILIMQKILETVIHNGARIAEPGEFTRRAFLNGRIDLSRAEAVMDLIHAQNEFALKASQGQLRGSVSDTIKRLREEIIFEIAFIESALDDPEHISTEGYPQRLSMIIESLQERIRDLISSADNGKILKEGIKTVIVGKPNAGKSSLLNLMVGEEKAIVTNVPGTTRDVLEETIRLHGIGLRIIDTAGIRTTDNPVEKIGVERAREYAADADLLVYVVDSSVPLDQSDEEIITLIQGKKVIILLNKTDLPPVVTEEVLEIKLAAAGCQDLAIIRTSTREKKGITIFEERIRSMFVSGDIVFNNEVVITDMRHKKELQNAEQGLCLVKTSLENGMPEDFYSIDLMSAYVSLGKIIGAEVGEDLVNEIFSKFCMGK